MIQVEHLKWKQVNQAFVLSLESSVPKLNATRSRHLFSKNFLVIFFKCQKMLTFIGKPLTVTNV